MGRDIAVKLFGVSQAVILIALIVAIILYRRRHQENVDATEMKFDVDLRASIKRAPAYQPKHQQPKAEALKTESALPTWDKSTPPHEILGVHPSADAATVEAAFRQLLKRYHPDRVASWGKGYQSRAHHIILLLQDARDRMLGKK